MYCFDFDGVIADSRAVCLAACEHACQVRGGALGDADPFATLDPLTFEAIATQRGLDPAVFARDVSDYVASQPQVSTLIPGMGDALHALAETAPLAIISATHGKVLRRFLDAHDLAACFDHVIGGDAGLSKAEVLKRLADHAETRPTVMVGDAISDIRAAHAADLPCIAVTWGWQPRHMLTGADRIVSAPADLLSTISELGAA
ncbi:HAD family hydrolase [Lutimaribacter marinistellae]|uniref:phosphoglycolate phosphatase n=1 Tax=Lutimaribacter marinistellae TaxID=1820329 RepID=A0ABV7TIK0_9RHOB